MIPQPEKRALDLPATEAQADGRRRRSQDSRARIVSAMLELVREGSLQPAAEQVANRAQVGLRTVFRHFKDMDSLYLEMSRAVEAELSSLSNRPLSGATSRERVLGLIERRAAVFEKIAPFRRASDVSRHRSRYLDERNDRLGAQLRAALLAELRAGVLEDAPTLEILDLLMSFESWDRLRTEQKLSAAQAKAVLCSAVGRLLPGA